MEIKLYFKLIHSFPQTNKKEITLWTKHFILQRQFPFFNKSHNTNSSNCFADTSNSEH